MLFPTVKGRTDPEKAFGIFRNDEASTAMVDGDLVTHYLTAADGIGVIFGGTGGTQLTVAGIVSGKDIAVGDHGTVQVYGYHGNVKAIAGVTAGAAIKSGTTARTVMIGATADDPVAQIGIALTATASSRIKAFLRVM